MEKTFLKQCIAYEVDGFCSNSSSKSPLMKLYRRHLCPETNCVYLIRLFLFHIQGKGYVHKILGKYYSLLLMRRYSVRVGDKATIGLGFHTAHPYGIILNNVTIGLNFFAEHNITIGVKYGKDSCQPEDLPHIGNNVQMYAGSFIIGRIKVDDNVIIGANACLINDTDGAGTYVGTPARRINKIMDS